MASVDDRIVRMEFDNAAFEKKLESTLASLANLDKALKFEGAKQGLSEVQGIGDKFNLGTMATHIESVSGKFLAMGAVAFTVLSNITTKVIQTGAQIAKSLSLDLVISGFREYETNIKSIQTILSNTKADGTNLQDVTAALDELNQYSDQTIYNFGQMVKNIGTFTAAGVDLETSVASIKGISNVAAISGSSAEQAANAMYQLSQAVSTGSLKLMDWNSVVNAGMGGEVLQKALFETGKAMGTLNNVPMSQSFEEWKKAGNSFRASLEQEWITAEVLTTTLKGFTGEMTEAQLLAIGYTKEQAAEIIELGKTGVDAATKVRTLTGLIETTKEAIGSGWSESFRIVIGNFEEATDLFTGISTSISNMVRGSADARNTMLQEWKDLGGRDLLIEGLRTAVRNFGEILAPIKDAFREIFPKTTADQLFELTKAFELLAIKLRPSAKTVENIHSVFKGFFSILQIGWEVIKEGAKFIGRLFDQLGTGSGAFLDFAGKVGDFFTALNDKLVEGKGVERFFENLSVAVQLPIAFLKDLIELIKEFFGSFADSKVIDASSEAVDRVSSRFEHLKGVFENLTGLWEPLKDGLQRVQDILSDVWEAISNWFEELGQKLAAVLEPGDFDAAVDAINVGLLGGLVVVLQRFFKHGLKLDIGEGFLSNISKSFDALTGTLTAMQTNIKANALLKIAGAIAILTASVLVLSLIDSEALTKALTAMAVGFGQLMASFAILTKLSIGPASAASFDLIATGLILLASSLVILAGAVKILAGMSWEELSKGLVGITVLLGVLTAAVIPLSSMSGGMISAGVGLIALGVALNVIAVAMKIFATMSWGEIGKGLATVAGLLTGIAVAVNLMPSNLILTGPGLLAVAASLVILAGAMKIFATMSWEDIAKGLVSVAGGLVIIGLATQLMSSSLPMTGAGLVLVSIALNGIASAMKIMATMSWEEIAKGMAAMAGSLLILAVATQAMTGSIAGAFAIGVVSVALIGLSIALKEFAKISWDDLLHGLAAMGGALATLGLAALLLQPVIPALLGLGAALILIGGGFALFGAGIALVAKGLETIAKIGAKAGEVLPDLIKGLGKGITAFMRGVAEGFLEMAQTLADGAPVLVKSLVVILGHILDGLVELIPKALVVIGELINGIIEYIGDEGAPRIIQAGIDIILALLEGIASNIGQVVKLAVDIITNFLDALAGEAPRVIDSITNLFVEIFLGVAEALGRTAARLLFGVGVAFIQGFMDGISESAASGPIKWFTELPGKIVEWIGNVARSLWDKGTELLGGLANGIADKANDVKNFFADLPSNIAEWMGDVAESLKNKGIDIIKGLANGIEERWTDLINWVGDIPQKIKDALPNPFKWLLDVGENIIRGLKQGLLSAWHIVEDWVKEKVDQLKRLITHPWEILSPSKYMIWVGEMIIAGFVQPFEQDTSMDKAINNFMGTAQKSFENSLTNITNSLGDITEFQPTITPVLDLTQVARDAKQITSLIPSEQTFTPAYSYQQAQMIATGTNTLSQPQTTETQPQAPGVSFEQNIYAPSQLSTSDIYKQTRNQIAMAKEELEIP